MWGSRSRNRFNLLLLDEGEYYFDDFSAIFFPPLENDELAVKRSVKGRLKLCSASLIFEPDDLRLPITKYPFKDFEVCQRGMSPLGNTGQGNEVFLIVSNLVVEMKENNLNTPYVFRKEKKVHRFNLKYENLESFLPRVKRYINLARLPRGDIEYQMKLLLEEREKALTFDPSWIVSLSEQRLLETSAVRVTPLVHNPGRLLITNLRIYFQPLNTVEGNPVDKFNLCSVIRMVKRRHQLRHIGLELFFEDSSAVFFAFKGTEKRDEVFNLLISQPELRKVQANDQSDMTLKWQYGLVSNFDYLMYVNSIADRTFNDLTQYPVFPWIIQDYTSPTLNLNDPKTFRDLSKPIGALNPQRLNTFLERFKQMAGVEGQPSFMYGTHYSTPGYVLYYLVRQAPEYMLKLQNGKFDAPDRMFHSIREAWNNVLTNPSDVKELIPEFYQTSGDFLRNSQGLVLGIRSSGEAIGDAVLPPWAKDPSDFVQKCRAALESECVSENLHRWIDLIFGYKQRGEEAIKANNLFYHLTYEGAVDIDAVRDPIERLAIETQINEFGQTPKQVFDNPHPKRLPPNQRGKLPEGTPGTASLHNLPQPQSLEELLGNLSVKSDATSSARSVSLEAPISTSSSFFEKLAPKNVIRLHRDSVTGLCVSSNQETLYSVSSDTTLKMYSLAEQRQLRNVNLSELTLSSCILAEDEKSVIVGSWDNNIYVYSIDYGRVSDTISAHDDAVSCICMRKDILLSGSWDSTVKVSQIRPNAINKVPLFDFADHDGEVKCITISADGSMAASGAADGSIMVMDLRMKNPIKNLSAHKATVNSLQFSSDGKRLVSCSSDQRVKVQELASGREVYNAFAGEGLRSVWTDGKTLLMAGEKGVIRVWDFTSGTERNSFKDDAGQESINCFVVSNDRKGIYTGLENGAVRVWSST